MWKASSSALFYSAVQPLGHCFAPRVTGLVGEQGDHREWSADAAGHLGPGEEVPWVEFVQTLHFNLTLPGALDRYLVGIFGTVLLASLFTGILVHRRILKDVFRLRWGGSKRLTNADLHNRMAATYGLPVAATGRPAPRLERLWTGLLWEQPLALAATALGEMTGTASALPVYWATTLLVWVIVLAAGRTSSSAPLLRTANGAVLLALGAVHLVTFGLPNLVSVGVDLLWVVLGLALCIPYFRAMLPARPKAGERQPAV
ncbi:MULTISPECIES: PepSY-associated TM helix domain-containing protein [unclassified Novosphingobium]|uniref:PepSY-associated TM helix domain-containing protein n=1 Tax=unclassified Novosphingobium TaxID=2644732 RepID=UPI001357E085|nr:MULTISPECIES: PepSY-associated TM helix domain-containing protein [unclassified Novosphingobium]